LKSWTPDEVTSRADYEALGLHNIENNIMAYSWLINSYCSL